MKLRYSVHPNGGLYFVEAGEARRVKQIEKALQTARTWQEFRSLLPEGEYQRVISRMKTIPADDMDFDPREVPGFKEGQYPPWHQANMERLLPLSILETYGQRKFSEDYGSYYHISPEHWQRVVRDLDLLGFRVEDEHGNIWRASQTSTEVTEENSSFVH